MTEAALTLQTPQPPLPVIVHNSGGRYRVSFASIDLARALLLQVLEAQPANSLPGWEHLKARQAAKANPDNPDNAYIVPGQIVLDAFKDILTLEPGQLSKVVGRVAVAAPLLDVTFVILPQLRAELVLWAFENKLNVWAIATSDLEELRPERSLSFLAGLVARAKGKAIQYVDTAVLDEAQELEVLLNGRWKPTASVENVVARYLHTVNRYTHRDDNYELGTLVPTEDLLDGS